MTSIGDSLPREVISHIFEHVHFRHAFSREDYGDYEEFFSQPFMPWLAPERRDFAPLRLVSRTWKAIADTFFFKDLVIAIGRFNQRTMSRQHRFLVSVLRAGYAELVRNVHLILQLDDNVVSFWERCKKDDDYYVSEDESPERPSLKFTPAGLVEYTDLVCDVLSQYSCRCLRLAIDILPYRPNNIEPTSGIIVNKVFDIWQSLPTNCKVECWIDADRSRSVPKGCYEQWFTTTIPEPASRVLSSLLIEDFLSLPISRTFFASLSCTTKLKIVHHEPRGEIYRGHVTNVEELGVGLLLMPVIEELTLISLPISNFPKTLRLLDVLFPEVYSPDADFFINICQLDALEELQLYDISTLHIPSNSDSPLLQITEPQLPNLRIFDVFAGRDFRMLQMFCSKVFRSCSSLQDIHFTGVNLTNETILSTATNSLRNLSLERHKVDTEQPEDIQFSTLCTLFERNPRISKLHFSFCLGLPPLTYEIIDSISNSCPRLEHVSMHADEGFRKIDEHADYAYELSSLYSRSSPTNDMVVKGALSYDMNNRTDDYQFILDLTEFRKLRDSDAVETSEIDVPGK